MMSTIGSLHVFLLLFIILLHLFSRLRQVFPQICSFFIIIYFL